MNRYLRVMNFIGFSQSSKNAWKFLYQVSPIEVATIKWAEDVLLLLNNFHVFIRALSLEASSKGIILDKSSLPIAVQQFF